MKQYWPPVAYAKKPMLKRFPKTLCGECSRQGRNPDEKVQGGSWDGIIFAKARKDTSGFAHGDFTVLELVVPAPAQGQLPSKFAAKDDERVFQACRSLHHEPHRTQSECGAVEFLYHSRGLRGASVFGYPSKDKMLFRGMVSSGRRRVKERRKDWK